jgi:hypothetical protein
MDRLLLSLSVLWRVLFSSQVMPRPSGSAAEASEAEVVVPASVALAARRSGPVALASPEERLPPGLAGSVEAVWEAIGRWRLLA